MGAFYTEEEQAILVENEYIHGVTSQFVCFSEEYKELFYKENQSWKKQWKPLKSLVANNCFLIYDMWRQWYW